MIEQNGWILDIYQGIKKGIVVWFLGEDGIRYNLKQAFPITFYANGSNKQLEKLERHLQAQPVELECYRTERRDIFCKTPLNVLAIKVQQPADQIRLFKKVSYQFPDITYYDADIPVSLRHASIYNSFPLAYCHATFDEDHNIYDFSSLDSPWNVEPIMPPLRILSIEPDCAPDHEKPRELRLRFAKKDITLKLKPERPLLVNLSSILKKYDPDLILTAWGDKWLLPFLINVSKTRHIALPLNRDLSRGISYHAERSYFTYGQIIHRDQQIHLFGRLHIDAYNAMLYHDYGLEGVFELARVTSSSLQSAARVSPGSGISAMQMTTALRMNILVPWHKQQVEHFKTSSELLRLDQGGLVFQPTIGLHYNVAELDFISMYPSIMVHCNISPETVNPSPPWKNEQQNIPTGLIPKTLAPLLDKRISIKQKLATMSPLDIRYKRYKAQASAHKWLLVTCFGYLGYKNARFGRIEAHEAVTTYGREILLRAKETAEDMGYTVLHLYVDGIWVKKDSVRTVEDLQPLLEEIVSRTGLPIALDGIYNWLAFLPSRADERIPVANRYFGAFQDGSIKSRGIELRRRDTPIWIAEIQVKLLSMLSKIKDQKQAEDVFPDIFSFLNQSIYALRTGHIPLKKLVISQKISRNVSEYVTPSPAAKAAGQLSLIGKDLRPGQIVRFIYVIGQPNIHAWNLPKAPRLEKIDIDRYCKLLLRAALTILQPFGINEKRLKSEIFYHVTPQKEYAKNPTLFRISSIM